MFGAFLPPGKVVNLIFNCLGKVVTQIPGATLHNALGISMLLGCADVAKMDSRDAIFSCSNVAVFIERRGYYTISIKNINFHNQLKSKEIIKISSMYSMNDFIVGCLLKRAMLSKTLNS